jgi:hypothetical protein
MSALERRRELEDERSRLVVPVHVPVELAIRATGPHVTHHDRTCDARTRALTWGGEL